MVTFKKFPFTWISEFHHFTQLAMPILPGFRLLKANLAEHGTIQINSTKVC